MSTVEPPELWDVNEIAAYVRQSPQQVRDRLTHRPGFPAPIRGAARPKLYVKDDVIAYLLNRDVERSPKPSRDSSATAS